MANAAMVEILLGVDVKPTSGIVSWEGWPEDVRSLLYAWNRGVKERPHKLSFYRRGLFDCADCGLRCEPATSGVAYLNERWLCDDCLIARARKHLARRARSESIWRGGGTMRRSSGEGSDDGD